MAKPGIAETLDRLPYDTDKGPGEVVEFGPGLVVPRLETLPGEDAALLYQYGWRTAYFMGNLDREMGVLNAELTLGKPLEEEDAESINNEGFSTLPVLLARIIDEKGEISLVVCPEGTTEEDYWRDPDSPPASDYEWPSADMGRLHADEIGAMQNMYSTLALASGQMLVAPEVRS